MAENEQERTATEMASQAINAMNPNTLELRNAAAGGVADIGEAAAEIQDQAGGTMQQVGQQALNATKSLVERARDFAVEFSEQLWGGGTNEKDKI